MVYYHVGLPFKVPGVSRADVIAKCLFAHCGISDLWVLV